MDFSLTVIIIIITVLASLYAWNRQEIMQKWILNPYSVNHRREYYRLFTSGLIHNDYIHLFFNMFTLYWFGEMIESVYTQLFGESGKVLYVAFYIIGIVVSSIPTYLKHKNHSYYNSLGASGGVSAVIFASILFFPTEKLYLFGVIGIPGFIFGGLYMIYSYMQAKRGGDFINHDAHLFGGLFGILFTIIVVPQVVPSFFNQLVEWRLF